MAKRTSINDIKDLEDLNNLSDIVNDKRIAKRAKSKQGRRDRHYTKLLIKEQLKGNDV